MSKNSSLPPQKNTTQSSILGFVNSPNRHTGQGRQPRSLKKVVSQSSHIRGSSSGESRKRKLSEDTNSTKDKRINMEPNNKPAETEMGKDEDKFMTALKNMETRITDNLTKSMKNMISALETSLNSLVSNQQEWEQQRKDVKHLLEEKIELKNRICAAEERNENLETRVKKLEDRLKECNLIIHGIKETNWEPDSTRHELVIKEIAETVTTESNEKKMEIARKIPDHHDCSLGQIQSIQKQADKNFLWQQS